MTDAIDDLRRRLVRYPASTHPLEHATIRFNVGLALAEAPDDGRETRLRQAIVEYAAALSGFPATAHPTERARVLTALGAAERDLGMPLVARDRFLEALALVGSRDSPAETGAAANGLGLVHMDLGQPADAIEAYRVALEAFGESHTRQRATTMHNLGLALASSGTVAALEAALAVYRDALGLVEPESAAYVWASLHHALALALLNLPDDRPRRLTEAIRSESAALTVFTRAAYPFQHAVAKNNLGIAFEEIPSPDVTMLRRALVAFEDAAGLLDPRLHRDLWNEARSSVERALNALIENTGLHNRMDHFVQLLASAGPPERMDLLRYRMGLILERAEPGRSALLAELDRSVVALDLEPQTVVTRAWMTVLMEHPHDVLRIALESRHDRHLELEGPSREQGVQALEIAVGDLEVIQRVMVRDLLTELGHERPAGS